ncbi:MAG TPA: hypothetical protein QGF05_00255 [Dehalococcoidia bacterium]|nr:hypothetical protein [Dehalococcoidia bacterium]
MIKLSIGRPATQWRWAILVVVLATLVIAAACGNSSREDQSTPDVEPLPGATPTDTASFLSLLDELELDWVVPEIALQRDWAEQGGSLVQITDPRSEWELYDFTDAASLDRFIDAARAGEVADLPVDAFAWTSDDVVFFLRAAEQSPETVQRFVSLFGEPVLATGSAVSIVDSTEQSGEADSSETDDRSEPRTDSPPDAVVAVGTEAVRVGIGTYCWTGPEVGICADAVGRITGLGTLHVSRGELFVLQAELPWETLSQSYVSAWSQDTTKEIEAGEDWRAWSPEDSGVELPAAVSSGQLQLTADLAPGAYIVEVRLLLEPGDVSYGFLLNVEGDAETNDSGPEPAKDPGYEQVRAAAPIETVIINIAESFPVQYFVAIQSGLPSGCAAFAGIDSSVVGTEIRIDVWNLVPAPSEPIACTAIYGTIDNTVALGSDFDSGTEYTGIVNGEERAAFVAQ